MKDNTESSSGVAEPVAVAEAAADTIAPQTAVEPPRRRLLYFDNLRTMLTWLVVVHHAAVAYSDIPMWYYMEPVHDRSAVALDILLVFDQTFFMGFFFLISGYFVPPAYDRKRGGKFLRERLIRLGIPLVVFIIVLGPILKAGFYSVAKAEATAKGIDLPYWEFYLSSLNPGPLWFVEVLLLFCALYVLARWVRGEHPSDLPTEAREIGWRPAVLGILGYAFALAVVSYLWRIVVPLGQIWPIVGLPTPAYMSQYATLFIVGVIACRRGWAQTLPVSAGWFGLALFLGMIALGPILALVGSIAMVGGGTWQSMAMATWESLAAVGVIVALCRAVSRAVQPPGMARTDHVRARLYRLHHSSAGARRAQPCLQGGERDQRGQVYHRRCTRDPALLDFGLRCPFTPLLQASSLNKEHDMRLATWSFAWTTLLAICLAAAPALEKQSKEDKTALPRIIPVWPKDAPGSEKWTQKEAEYSSALLRTKVVCNVVRPTLTAFWPGRSKANGTAVIICPGGGFRFLAKDEGIEEAERLRARGVAAFILKHRLMDTGATEVEFHKSLLKAGLLKAIEDRLKGGEQPVLPEDVRKFSALAVADGWQAIKVVREHAGEWGIKPDRIGIMGFSSGGVVSTGVATEHDAASRPNYAASIYGPVLGSVKVPKDAPPLFICCASDDPLVPSRDSIRLYSAWQAAGKSAELHIYAKGGHGFGGQGLPSDTWLDRFGDWLGQQGFLKAEKEH